jgi:hypothetical protein
MLRTLTAEEFTTTSVVVLLLVSHNHRDRSQGQTLELPTITLDPQETASRLEEIISRTS